MSETIPDPRGLPREALMAHWNEAMQDEERTRLLAAWQARRSCADCTHWGDDYDRTHYTSICCGAPANRFPGASFMVPPDYTCEHWEADNAR